MSNEFGPNQITYLPNVNSIESSSITSLIFSETAHSTKHLYIK